MRTRVVIPYSVVIRTAIILWIFIGATTLIAWAEAEPHGGIPNTVRAAATVYGAVTLVGLVFSAFFSGSETAFLSANLPRLRRRATLGDRAAARAIGVTQNRERTQAFILVGTNIANVMAVASSLAVLQYLAGDLSPQWREGINTIIMTPLILLFGEILPKAIGRARPEAVLLRASPALLVLDWALRPITYLMLGASLAVMRLTGQKGEAHIMTREDLHLLAQMGETHGVLEHEHRRMIHGVLELHEQRVERVMRPLSDIVSVEEGTPLGQFLDIVVEHGYSRIPVYKDRVDNIVGVVNILDVIYRTEDVDTIDPFVRRALLFVPETKRVASLLTELRFRRNPMAFVVDEYGGIVGLVTMEDLVEEIVGEIRDERDDEEAGYQVNELTRTLECDGKTEIDDLNEELEKLGVQIPDGHYDTVAGFVIHQLDSIPQVSDVVETDDLMVIVLSADARTVQRVKIIPKGRSDHQNRRDN